MPCAGTEALIEPVLVEVALVQASRRVKEVPDLPIAAAVVLTVVVEEPWLNRATATSPSASRLASTRRVPSLDTWVACRPSESWLMAIRFWFFRMVWVAASMLRMSLPAISGDAMTAQRAKWLRISVSVMPPRPTSIMSGSLKEPGLA
ncbi:hypothetical protein GCM10027615_28860 [Plantactinospora veratri]